MVLVAGEGGRRGPAEGSGGGRGRPVVGGTEREGGRAHAGGEVGGGDGRKGSRAAAQTQGSVCVLIIIPRLRFIDAPAACLGLSAPRKGKKNNLANH